MKRRTEIGIVAFFYTLAVGLILAVKVGFFAILCYVAFKVFQGVFG